VPGHYVNRSFFRRKQARFRERSACRPQRWGRLVRFTIWNLARFVHSCSEPFWFREERNWCCFQVALSEAQRVVAQRRLFCWVHSVNVSSRPLSTHMLQDNSTLSTPLFLDVCYLRGVSKQSSVLPLPNWSAEGQKCESVILDIVAVYSLVESLRFLCLEAALPNGQTLLHGRRQLQLVFSSPLTKVCTVLAVNVCSSALPFTTV
jgi:hypothetical protein